MFLKRATIQEKYTQDFVLSDRILPLTVSVSARAKKMTLRIASGGRALKVSIPIGTSKKAVNNFLNRYQGWIVTKVAHLPPPVLHEPMLKAGVKIPILGKNYLVVHKAGRGIAKIVEDEQDGLQIWIYGDEKYLPRRLRDLLLKQADLTIAPLVAKYASQVARKVKSIRYKDTKSRWGSCSHDGCLTFSWRIMMAPYNVVDYLVAHEVSHLVEMNHGRNFWKLCETLCPQSKACRAWLKRNGQSLHAIVFS